jgi:hypothetical protein
MRTLESLQEEFGYKLLTPTEIKSVRERTVNWKSVEGEIVRRKALKSYPANLQLVNWGYIMTPFHYSLAANFQRCIEKGPNPGMPYGLILASAPPQVGKSLSTSESLQQWILTNNPRAHILTAGYEATFAMRFGRRNREKFGEWAPILTHDKVKLHDKIQSVEDWETMVFDENSGLYLSANGGMATAGIGGPLTGKPATFFMIDDPIKNMKDAGSDIRVYDNIEYYQSAIETRLLGNPGSICVVMCTRWVVNDMIGWLRRHRKQFIVGDFNYAALSTEQNCHNDPLGRLPGEGICPEMGKDANWARIIEESYTASQGGHVFGALFQGEPTNELGNLFRLEDWGEYEVKNWDPAKMDRVYLSIDATFKDNDENDYVAMYVGGVCQGNQRIRYIVRKRMDLADTVDKIVEIVKKFPEIDVIYIEDKANGPGVVSVIRKWRKRLGIPEEEFPSVIAVTPEGSKYARASEMSVYQRDGRWFIPCEKDAHLLSSPNDFEWEEQGLSYTHCFKQELGTFPFGAFDDMVDMCSQANAKCRGLMDGDEKPTKRVTRFSRYSNWWPEMWSDYRRLKTQDEKSAFIKMHGAPTEWKKIP